MKISVNADGHRFTIPFPTGIALNAVTTRLIASYLNKYAGISLTAEQLNFFSYELRHAKKLFPGLALVDVQTSDGNKVKITL